MRDKELAQHISCSFRRAAEALEKIPKIIQIVELVQLQRNCPDWEDPNLQCRKCDEVARRYRKEIAVVEPVKGGALMNLPEEAAVFAVPS